MKAVMRVLLIVAAAFALAAGCEDSALYPHVCPYTNDGQCDEPNRCGRGTDSVDCSGRGGGGGGNGNGGGNGGGGGGNGGGGGGNGGGNGGTPPGGAGACPGVTYPDDFEEYLNHPDPKPSPPGWDGPPTTIQVTTHCTIACIKAFEIGPNSSQVQTLCRILFANFSQTHEGRSLPAGYCRVCNPHRPTGAGTIDSLFEPAD